MTELPEQIRDSTAVQYELTRVHDKWRKRLAYFRSLAPPDSDPLAPPARHHWQTWMDVAEFLHDYAGAAHTVLKFGEIPTGLKQAPYSHLPAFWRLLPEEFQDCVAIEQDQFFVWLCAVAAPPRFGTQAGRYPEQTQWLASQIQDLPDTLYLLDYGSGTGQGSYEFADELARLGRSGHVLGITAEFLETWMAQHRTTPHLDSPYPAAHESFPCDFRTGDILSFTPAEQADLIVCNGLIGGPFLNSDEQLSHLWRRIAEQLKPTGILIVGDRFHAGREPVKKAFLQLKPSGFSSQQIGGSHFFMK